MDDWAYPGRGSGGEESIARLYTGWDSPVDSNPIHRDAEVRLPSSIQSRGRGRGLGSFRARFGRPTPMRVFMPPGQPAEIDARIADDSDKALVASFGATHAAISGEDRPLRPDFGTDGKEIKLRTNFFPVRVPKGPLYDYDIGIFPNAPIRRVKKRVIHLAEQTVAWRQANMRRRVAHDSNARLISAIRLPQPLTITVPYYDEGETGPPQQGGRVYTISINFIQEMDTESLASYLAGETQYRNYDVLPILAALNVILTSLPNKLDIMVGSPARYFPRPVTAPLGLGGGLEAWKGFYPTTRPLYKQLMVRISTCTTAFYTPGNLARALTEFRQATFGAQMNMFCRGVHVRTTHLGQRKIVKRVTRESETARTCSVDTPEYGRVTLEDYFRQKHNVRLNYPDLPLVDVGGPTRQSYLPAEVCDILPGQPFRGKLDDLQIISMQAVSRQSPAENAAETVNKFRNQLATDVTRPELEAFGVTIGPNMAVVPGHILPTPGVKYSSGTPSIDSRASWNLVGVKFAVGARLDNWVVLVIKDRSRDEFTDASDQDLRWAIARFCNICAVSGMNVNHSPTFVTAHLPTKIPSDPMRQAAIATIRSTLLTVKQKPSMVFVVLANGDSMIYEGLKHLCDVFLDVATVCVQSSRLRKNNDQYLANMSLKVNMKLGGINHELDSKSGEWLNSVPTMIVGIDVSHPNPGCAMGTPSIAAVVASVDNHFSQYSASLEIQETEKEVVTNMKNMMIERLELFRKRNDGKLPERIVVYRSGVSEGQFDAVKEAEIPSMLDAFKSLSSPKALYRPKLSVITCGNKGHVRFYATDEDNASKDGNPLPGTVVDRGITAIYDFDFFLQSHGGLQGTTRPVHYYVIHDEIKFKADEIQGLTNSLSYMFARATKAVRLASPVYYANLACRRGRCYLRKLFHGYLGDVETESRTLDEQTVRQEVEELWNGGVSQAGLKDTMFYL